MSAADQVIHYEITSFTPRVNNFNATLIPPSSATVSAADQVINYEITSSTHTPYLQLGLTLLLNHSSITATQP